VSWSFNQCQRLPREIASVARKERSEIRGGIDASWQSRITLRSIRATLLDARAKIASLRIFAVVIDFRFRSHRVSTPLRSNVSRQQGRCFNDLQCLTSPHSATAFDNRRCIGLKAKILLTKGRLPEASREVERVRCPRADLQSAPGRLGYQSPGIMTGMGGASLDLDRRRRVTPVQTKSQEAWPEAEPLGRILP
jgi:hypothetical protein